MSVAALARLATHRDAPERGMLLHASSSTADADASSGDLTQYRDVVIHAIPTEVLAAYTALVGVVAAAATTGDTTRQYVLLRWSLLAIFAIATPLSVYVAVRVHHGRRHRVPWAEMGAATMAAGGWFLAMPGSPLFLSLQGSDGAVASACITVGVGFLLALVAPLLRRGTALPSTRDAVPRPRRGTAKESATEPPGSRS